MESYASFEHERIIQNPLLHGWIAGNPLGKHTAHGELGSNAAKLAADPHNPRVCEPRTLELDERAHED